MPKPKLTYFFEAEYLDGTIYKQNEQDASVKFPPIVDENGELQGKSCMSDIQEDVDNGKIKRFTLIGNGNKVTVDLTTGLFEVNGLPVILESVKLPALPRMFKLIYYRQGTVNINATYNIKTGQMQDSFIEGGIFLEYFIGWECNINGKTYRERLGVA